MHKHFQQVVLREQISELVLTSLDTKHSSSQRAYAPCVFSYLGRQGSHVPDKADCQRVVHVRAPL